MRFRCAVNIWQRFCNRTVTSLHSCKKALDPYREILRHAFHMKATICKTQAKPGRPLGFAQFAVTLRSVLTGSVEPSEVVEPMVRLDQSLEEAREKLHRMAVPARVMACISPARKNAETLLSKLTQVLDLVDDFLYEGSRDALEEALSILDLLQGQVQPVY